MDTFAELRAMRDKPGANQEKLAPMEHRAFAREWVQENPLVAVPSLAVATPLYAGAKALGLMSGRTKPSLYQVGQGYAGIIDGLKALSLR
jgi:hypothetical protein